MANKIPFKLDVLKSMAKEEHKSEIYHQRKLNYDGKNIFVRLPKEVVDYLNLEKGQTVEIVVDTTTDKKEAIIQCKPLKES